MLVNKDAESVQVTDRDGETALKAAQDNKHEDVAAFLMDRVAKVEL